MIFPDDVYVRESNSNTAIMTVYEVPCERFIFVAVVIHLSGL